ncbi:lysylphosphatidylglycerol synthase transmembrane domain-containing protein [Pseudomonadota bacterium]
MDRDKEDPNLNKRSVVVIKLVVGVAVAVFTVYWVDATVSWSAVFELLAGVSLLTVLMVVAGIVLSHFLRAFRLMLCYRHMDSRFREICGIAFVHNSLNFWLPMRLGEVALPILSKTSINVGYADSVLTLAYIRQMDIHVLLLLVFIFAGGSVFQGYYYWVVLACLAGFPLIVFSTRFWSRRLRLVRRIQTITGSGAYVLAAYFVTLAVWLAKLGGLSYLALELSDIQFDHAWVAIILADATSVSPITGLANAGTFEAGFVLPLGLLGYGQAETLSVAVAIHIVLGLVSLAVGILGWMLLDKNIRYVSGDAGKALK